MKFPSQSDSWIGCLLGDRQRYRLDKRIAVGGMGEIFLAMDTVLGKQVALKLLKDTLVESEELRKRFEWEVALYAALKSDHIVEVSDYGVTAQGYPFFVMEYLRGHSLGQLLRQKQRLSIEQTVNIITQVCDGLQLAHTGVTLWRDQARVSEQIKVVHRDLKPDNIFLVPTALGELVKILDFGIAKIREAQAEHTNLTNTFLGTFHYAAPEQLEFEKDLDARADIYSLGIILYEMLSGTDPFGMGFNTKEVSISNMSWALAHKFKPPVPLQVQPCLGQLLPELEAVVMRCLQKEPERRFASVDELKQALQGAAIANTHRQLQQSLEQTEKKSISPIEPKVNEKSNFNPALAVDKPQGEENQKKVRQLLLPTVIAAVVGMGLSSYYYTKGQTDQSEKKALELIQLLKVGKNYEECVNQARAVSQTSPFYTNAQNLLNQCQSNTQGAKLLAKAKELAQENNFKDAISEIGKIQPDSSFFQAAQQLINQWSLILVKQAEELYKQSYKSQELENAIGITKAIPKTNSVAKNAEKLTEDWRIEWNNNENYLHAAQNALKQARWQEAIDKTNKVRLLGQKVKQDTPYWQNKMKPIIEKAQKRTTTSKIQGRETNNVNELDLSLPHNLRSQPIPSPNPSKIKRRVLSQPKYWPKKRSTRPPIKFSPNPSKIKRRVLSQPKHWSKKRSTRPPIKFSPDRSKLKRRVVSQPKHWPQKRSTRPPIKLSPEAKRILCDRSPLNSRCGSKH